MASDPPRPGQTEPPMSEMPEPQDGTDEGDERVRRRRLERVFRDVVRRGLEKGIEAGLGTLSKSEEALRGVGELNKVPREIAGYVFSQIDETKNVLVRVVAREVRDFLQATDLANELQKALTSLSFQIRTEIRFVPNDAGKGVKSDVKTRVTSKRVTAKDRDGQAEGPDDPLDDSDS